MAKPIKKQPSSASPQPAPSGPAPAVNPAAQPIAQPNRPIPAGGAPTARPIPATAQPIPVAPGAAAQTVRAQESIAAKARGEDPNADEEEVLSDTPIQDWLRQNSNWLTSAGVHALALLILALIILPGPARDALLIISAPDDLVEPDDDLDQDAEIDVSDEDDVHPNEIVDAPPEAPISEQIEINMVEEGKLAFQPEPDMTSQIPNGPQVGPDRVLGTGKGNSGSGQGLGGRGNRRAGAGGRGASKASEDAVELALRWLAEHQMPDGGWNFDHRIGYCDGRCRHEGTGVQARNGATGLALLPFLGAGYTHASGKYKRKVADGIKFLLKNIQVTPNGGSFHEPEGTMYSHGLATLALCEAYGMTKGSGGNVNSLGKAASAAVKFIEYAQGTDGGWRYTPKEAGDTSVVSWQLMALKSAEMAYLPVDPKAFEGASKFLDSVQAGAYGARYGYNAPGEGSATTAIGMLGRMYMGWERNKPGLARGMDWLAEKGPSNSNLYYDYYATQVMFHYTNAQGERWKAWNEHMRDHLVATQAKDGHERGSWYYRGGDEMGVGGRLYYTAMAAMILEVYYRHMPIYSNLARGDLDNPTTKDE